MNSKANEFETLRKLMALKRHEQPPPGYFRRLPDQIAARLERGDGKLAFWEGFLSQFTFRPALAYSMALAAFSALTLSVIYSVRTQPQESALAAGSGWQSSAEAEALANQASPSEPLHVVNWMGHDNVSNPIPALPSLFDSGAHRPAMAVKFASP
jgi:hypothetical protein